VLQHRNRFAQLQSRLRLLAPDNVLARGYSITTDAASGRVLRAASEVKPGQRLKTRLKSGEVRSVVEE
jgi:exodeoxyribonuclease VII large subunit